VTGRPGAEATDEAADSVWTSTRALKTWTSGVFVALGFLFEFLLTGNNAGVASLLGTELFVSDALFLVAIAVGGQAIVRNGYYSLRNLSLDIDLLMSVAILGAIAASLAFGERLYFEAATQRSSSASPNCWSGTRWTARATPSRN